MSTRGSEFLGEGNAQKYTKPSASQYRLAAKSILDYPNKFVGPERCGECHAVQYQKWKRSRHAQTVRFPGEHPEVDNDLKKKLYGSDASILPDGITLGGTVLAVPAAIFALGMDWTDALLGGLVGGGTFLAVLLVFKRLRGVDGMGFGDVKLMRQEFKPVAGTEYDVIFTMKSSQNIMFNMLANHNTKDGDTAAWAPIGSSAWNVAMGSKYQEYKLTFTVPEGENENVQLIFELGKHSMNDVSNPDSYVVDILYVKVVERVGEEYPESVFKTDFTAENPGMSMSNTALGSVAFANGKAVATITGYGEAGWTNKLEQDTTVNIVKGKKYRLTLKMTAKNAQSGEFCIEDKVTEYQARALYDNINLAAGEEFVYTKDFFAEKDVENTSMKFYVGGASAGVTSNEITVTEWEISELVGDKSEDKALYRFIPYSKASEWDCFNGRESDIGSGMGTMYEKDGSMFYRVDELSALDYGNKIFVNKITLEKDALYKIRFTIKANKAGKTWFILNQLDTSKFEPTVSEVCNLTTEEQTFEFTTDREFPLALDFELVWSFGQGYNTEGDYLIEISNVEILKLT